MKMSFPQALNILAPSLIAALALAAIPLRIQAENRPLPADGGYVNVKSAPFNAVGNGIADDTAAIQAAINSVISTGDRNWPPHIYFPSGTYLISNTLISRLDPVLNPWSDGWRRGVVLMGQDQQNTTIKLKNKATGFTNASSPKAMIFFGSQNDGNPNMIRPLGNGNQAFNHSVINMTVNTGSGNVGAIGIDYLVNNQGCIKDVTVKTSDGQKRGIAGVSMLRGLCGPGLIQNLTVIGFNYGIRHFVADYSMTYHNITLQNQKTQAIECSAASMYIENLNSTNTVPVFTGTGNLSQVLVLGGNLTGGGSGNTAFTTSAQLMLRNVTVSGYGSIVDDTSTPNRDLAMSGSPTTVSEYLSETTTAALHPSPNFTLNLPTKEAPTFWTSDFSKWAKPQTFQSGSSTAGIQEAIDSGAEVVYLPFGKYSITQPIKLRNNLKMLIGMKATIQAAGGAVVEPLVQCDAGNSTFVTVEHISIGGGGAGINKTLAQNSDRQLAVKHAAVGHLKSIAGKTGDIFVEDVMVRKTSITAGVHLYSRQHNAESNEDPLIDNDGGEVRVLGIKTEGGSTIVKTRNGGGSEILGTYAYVNNQANAQIKPMFIIDEGSATITYNDRGQYSYATRISDKRNGSTLTLSGGQNPQLLYRSYEEEIWQATDIGAVGAAGSSSESGGTFTLSGAGVGLSGATDEFHFLYRDMTGDGEVIARVTAVDNTNTLAQGGVMIRASLDANAPFASMGARAGTNGVRFSRRTSAGTNVTAGNAGSLSLPRWVKVVRSGSLFSAYHSSDGASWTKLGNNFTIPMSGPVKVGLFTTSAVDATLCTSTLDNVTSP